MTFAIPGGPNHYVLAAGAREPFRLVDARFALQVAGLGAFSVCVAAPIARQWHPWGVVATTVALAVVLLIVLAAAVRALAFGSWWREEVHFEDDGAVLAAWYGTAERRGRVTRFAAGLTLAASVDNRPSIPRIVLSGGGKSVNLGPLWGLYPQEFDGWREWAEGRGWDVNDTYIADPKSTGRRPLTVGEHWVEFPCAKEAPEFVWGVPHGPTARDSQAVARTDWLPTDNGASMGAFTSTLSGAAARLVAARLGDVPSDATLVQFGAVASGATVSQGEVLAELVFAEPADAVVVSHTVDGRVELLFRRAAG